MFKVSFEDERGEQFRLRAKDGSEDAAIFARFSFSPTRSIGCIVSREARIDP
jgi:hypothetical protein